MDTKEIHTNHKNNKYIQKENLRYRKNFQMSKQKLTSKNPSGVASLYFICPKNLYSEEKNSIYFS